MTKHSGVLAKIRSSVSFWDESGVDSFVILYEERVVYDAKFNVIYSEVGSSNSWFDRLAQESRLFKLASFWCQYSFLKRALNKVKPDVTYCRYIFPMLGLRRSLRSAGRLVLEVNSDDECEYYIKRKITGIYNSLFRKYFLSRVDCLVFVTEELVFAKSFLSERNKPKVVIGNSVDVGSYTFVEKTGNDVANIVFIGSPHQAWHGLDKISALATLLPDNNFHVIGPSKEEYLASGGEEVGNIIFHGYLEQDKANILVSTMDVGLSTLSLYVKNMFEACPLKSRQYLSQGVPMIMGYKDPDMIGELEFVLSLPCNETNVVDHLKEICSFIKRCHGNKELRFKSRSFASEKLDISIKENERLIFLKSILTDRVSGGQ